SKVTTEMAPNGWGCKPTRRFDSPLRVRREICWKQLQRRRRRLVLCDRMEVFRWLNCSSCTVFSHTRNSRRQANQNPVVDFGDGYRLRCHPGGHDGLTAL